MSSRDFKGFHLQMNGTKALDAAAQMPLQFIHALNGSALRSPPMNTLTQARTDADKARAVAHYSALAAEANAIDYSRLAARLSNAALLPTLDEFQGLLRAMAALAARLDRAHPDTVGLDDVSAHVDMAFDGMSELYGTDYEQEPLQIGQHAGRTL
jgi:hypothetical protein